MSNNKKKGDLLEELVAVMHEVPGVEVERNVELPVDSEKGSGTREIEARLRLLSRRPGPGSWVCARLSRAVAGSRKLRTRSVSRFGCRPAASRSTRSDSLTSPVRMIPAPM